MTVFLPVMLSKASVTFRLYYLHFIWDCFSSRLERSPLVWCSGWESTAGGGCTLGWWRMSTGLCDSGFFLAKMVAKAQLLLLHALSLPCSLVFAVWNMLISQARLLGASKDQETLVLLFLYPLSFLELCTAFCST